MLFHVFSPFDFYLNCDRLIPEDVAESVVSFCGFGIGKRRNHSEEKYKILRKKLLNLTVYDVLYSMSARSKIYHDDMI